jgi:hypothetical protein
MGSQPDAREKVVRPGSEKAQVRSRTTLHLVVAFGLTLALSGGVVVASRLLPPLVEDATGRVWIGVSLAGIWIAGFAAIALYVQRVVRPSDGT